MCPYSISCLCMGYGTIHIFGSLYANSSKRLRGSVPSVGQHLLPPGDILGDSESKTIPMVFLHEHEESRQCVSILNHISHNHHNVQKIVFLESMQTQGENSESRGYFQEKTHVEVVRENAQARSLREDSIKLRPGVQLWNSYSAAIRERSSTFSFSAGGTHYCQARAVSSLHLLYSKHVQQELHDGVWCSKTSKFNYKLLAKTIHPKTSSYLH